MCSNAGNVRRGPFAQSFVSLAACYGTSSNQVLRWLSLTDTGWLQYWHVSCCLRGTGRTSNFLIGPRLAIIDDTPRREFNPRQRHTLKEFAVGTLVTCVMRCICSSLLQQVAMRELELWRDKVCPDLEKTAAIP